MANEEIKGMAIRLSLEDSTFKQGMKDLDNQIKIVDSGFKASVAGVKNWGSTLDGLGKYADALGKKITVQSQIVADYNAELEKSRAKLDKNATTMASLKTQVDAAKVAYDQSKTTLGENNEATVKLKTSLDGLNQKYAASERAVVGAKASVDGYTIQVNNATGKLNGFEAELKDTNSAIDNFGNEANKAETQTKQLGNDFDNTGKKALSFGDVLKANLISDAVVGGIRAIGSAVAAAAREFIQIAENAVNAADELTKLSDQTGFTTEQLQVMDYQGKDLGVSLDTMTGSMSKMINNMSSAKAGTGTAATAFKELGISVTDSNGNLRDSKQVYSEALAALGGVANETDRTAIAQDIFGRSAMELNPLIVAGTDGLKALEDQAYATGAIMSGETVAALDGMGDSLDHMKQSIETAAGTFVAQFAPALKEVSDNLTGLMSGSVGPEEFTESISKLVTQMTEAITSMLPSLIETGGGILTALIDGIVSSLPELVPAVADIIMELTSTLIESLPQIVQAGLQVIMSLALGIADALPELIPTVVSVIFQIVSTLIENIDQLIDAALEIIIALADGLITALPSLVEKIPEIITKLVEALTNPEMLTKLIGASIQLMIALAGGLIKAIPELTKAIPEIISALVTGLGNGLVAFANVGSDIVKGIWSGISGGWSWLITQVQGLAQQLLNNVKEFLGIPDSTTPKGGGSSARTTDGSFATGLNRVPFDGFVATLHKDEMVVPAADAEEIRKFGTTDDIIEQAKLLRVQASTAIMSLTSQVSSSASSRAPSGQSAISQNTAADIVSGLAAVIGAQGGSFTIVPSAVNLDGKKVGEITYTVHKDIKKQRGE